jgi:hypothetical protein
MGARLEKAQGGHLAEWFFNLEFLKAICDGIERRFGGTARSTVVLSPHNFGLFQQNPPMR